MNKKQVIQNYAFSHFFSDWAEKAQGYEVIGAWELCDYDSEEKEFSDEWELSAWEPFEHNDLEYIFGQVLSMVSSLEELISDVSMLGER